MILGHIKVLTVNFCFHFMYQCCHDAAGNSATSSATDCSSMRWWFSSSRQLSTRWISMGRETAEMALWSTGHYNIHYQSVSVISKNSSKPKDKIEAMFCLSNYSLLYQRLTEAWVSHISWMYILIFYCNDDYLIKTLGLLKWVL